MKLVKFEKNGCAPCKSVEQYLESKGVADTVQHVNIYDDPDAAFDYGIMSVPVLILLDDEGQEVDRSVGFSPDKLNEILAQYR